MTAAVAAWHEYTVSFLAYIIWDPVEMYNHLTNDWGDKEHEIPFDIYHPATRKFVFDTFEQWLKDSPQADVVRFTTFFYQFTLLFDAKRREKVVDWFGCACTVSPRALDDFEKPSTVTVCVRRISWMAVPTTPRGACPARRNATGSTSSPASCARTSSGLPTCRTRQARKP